MNANNETEVWAEASASTRTAAARIEGEILRRSADVTQAHAAKLLGVHPSTISRTMEDIKKFSLLLAAFDLQVATSDSASSRKANFPTPLIIENVGAVSFALQHMRS